MKNIYAITHTESMHHIQRIGGGWFDTPLTQRGKEQARQIAKYLKKVIGKGNVVFYCSDLLRASETCEIIANEFKKSVNKCSELREMCYGDAEGKPDDWVRENITPTAPNIVIITHGFALSFVILAWLIVPIHNMG